MKLYSGGQVKSNTQYEGNIPKILVIRNIEINKCIFRWLSKI